MEPDILRHLNAVLRVQLMAVQQHFIHVLTLKAWGDDETADGITAIDEVDLPNAMRIADLIVSTGTLPELSVDHSSLAEFMPEPDSSYEGIFAAECRLEGKMLDALHSAKNAVAEAGTHGPAHLILDPLAPRERYEEWLQEQIATQPRPKGSARRLPDDAKSSLDTLFAHLMVVIAQGLIHSFTHWHSGKKRLADAAWSASGAAMMQATDITNLLALRYSAPSPADAVIFDSVQLPCIGRTSEKALLLDLALAEKCRAVAERTRESLVGTEFEAVCRDSAAYFHAASAGQPNVDYPEVSNPCSGFERVLRQYVWPKRDAHLASA